jgi:hypothetical protein
MRLVIPNPTTGTSAPATRRSALAAITEEVPACFAS